MDRLKGIFFLFSIILLLQGCVDAAVTGAQAVYNRHDITKSLNDNYISMRSERKIYVDTDKFKNTHVTVAAFNGSVLLTGQVPHPVQRTEIEQIVRKIADQETIHNLITIGQPSSALTRMSDSWITAKVKSKLIAMNDIDPSGIKVLTENGTVYLMGVIPHDQADIAIDVARSTDGVQRVVKVFEYIHITKT